MKKKFIVFCLLVTVIVSLSIPTFASSILTTEDFKLYVKVRSDFEIFEVSALRFNLFTSDGEWLSNQMYEVSEPGIIEIDFPIGKYAVGTEFKLVATTGLDSFDYYGNVYQANEECLIGTYAYRDKSGELVICNSGYIETTPLTADNTYIKEAHVNDLALWSDTPYLIWVSKSNFTVNVFQRNEGRWNLISELPCSIGAPSTPTVTGQFQYHQYQDKWQYNGYYVGPIMRFYNGYALHSTLVNNDGTDRDGRVGEMISHGCVRLRPADIIWLTEIIPIDTKVYITE